MEELWNDWAKFDLLQSSSFHGGVGGLGHAGYPAVGDDAGQKNLVNPGGGKMMMGSRDDK